MHKPIPRPVAVPLAQTNFTVRLMVACFICICAATFAENRTWKDVKGNSMVAEFVRFQGNFVILKRAKDGKIRKVLVKTLTQTDKNYLKSVNPRKKSSTKVPVTNKTQKASKKTGSDEPILNLLFDQPKPKLYAILAGFVIVNVLLVIGVGKWFFGGLRGFGRCILFWFQPDWISAFRGEFGEDLFSSFKLFLFIIVLIVAFVGQIFVLDTYIL